MGFALAELVDVRLHGGWLDVEVVVEEAQHAGGVAALYGVVHGEELDAVAGGEDHRFADAGLVGEGSCGVG